MIKLFSIVSLFLFFGLLSFATLPVEAATKKKVTRKPAKVKVIKKLDFANCTQARKAGYHDMRVGHPGYKLKLDRDKDGIACEILEKGN